MEEQDFEVRIGECTIKCNKQHAMTISGVILKFLRSNPDAQSMDIKLSYFSESQDTNFVYQILNENGDITLSPGREIFFRYFCTEMELSDNRKASVQVSSIINHNESLDILMSCEERLMNLNKINFVSASQFFKDNSESILSSQNKYSTALLFLNSCFARPFEIELYLQLLYELSKYEEEHAKKSDEDEPSFFESFMKCFSFELGTAFRSSAEYPYIDEIVFILCLFSKNSKLFNEFIKDKINEESTDFLSAYYKDQYNMISFNSLKPLFIEFVRITDFDVDLVLKKYSEEYSDLCKDNFFLHKCHAPEGINGDKLARLIIFDESEKLENVLLKSYRYMKENSNKIEEEKKENSSSNNSSIMSLSSNNNFSVEYEPINNNITFGNDSFPSLIDSSERLIIRNVTFEENDIKKIASKLASPVLTIDKSIYERCTLLNKECTLLEYAAFFGSKKCFEMLLRHQKDDQNQENEEDFVLNLNINSNLGRYAVAGGSKEIIEIIQTKINKSDSENENPVPFSDLLEFAVRYHRWEIAEWLVEKMDNKFKYNSDFLNKCIQYCSMKILHYFIKNHIQMSNDFLLNCFQYGNFCLAEWALSFATRDIVNQQDSDDFTSILHWACLLNNKPLLMLILQHRRENRNRVFNTSGRNAKYNEIKISNYYVNENLDFGVAINTKSGHYYHDSTALHLAVEDNNFEFTKIILDEGILNHELPKNLGNDDSYQNSQHNEDFGSLDIERKNRNTMTPFHIACKNGNLEIVKLFLNHKDYHVDINAETAGVLFYNS